ncbi:MAG: hypothetical protein ACREMD_11705 [Gemmatimonadota bacterium]
MTARKPRIFQSSGLRSRELVIQHRAIPWREPIPAGLKEPRQRIGTGRFRAPDQQPFAALFFVAFGLMVDLDALREVWVFGLRWSRSTFSC